MDNHVFTITEREALRTGASAINTLLGWLTPDTSFNGLSFHELKDIADSLERMANRRAAPAPPAADSVDIALAEQGEYIGKVEQYGLMLGEKVEKLEEFQRDLLDDNDHNQTEIGELKRRLTTLEQIAGLARSLRNPDPVLHYTENISTEDNLAGYGSAAPAGEPGRGERSGEGEG